MAAIGRCYFLNSPSKLSRFYNTNSTSGKTRQCFHRKLVYFKGLFSCQRSSIPCISAKTDAYFCQCRRLKTYIVYSGASSRRAPDENSHCPQSLLALTSLTVDNMKAQERNKLNSFLAPRKILNPIKEFLTTIAIHYQLLALKHWYVAASDASRISSVVYYYKLAYWQL